MRKLAILLFIFCISIIIACKHEKEAVVNPAPTPYGIDFPVYFGNNPKIPDNNKTTVEGVQLGRMLFYDPILSKDNSISCANCHRQQNAFSDPNKFSFGVGATLGKRNSMSLSNLMWQENFFWDGRADSLEEQALFPIQDPNEMHADLSQVVNKLQASAIYPSKFKIAFGSDKITTENLTKALAQFERTLISSNSKFDKFKLYGSTVFTPNELNGFMLFTTHPIPGVVRGGNCGDCHGGPLQLSNTFENNGLDPNPVDEGRGKITGSGYDNGKFKVPSLRNIALTAPYMHDGRFTTLEEILDHYNEHINMNSPNLSQLISLTSNDDGGTTLDLTPEEKKDIITFLNTLTDSTFITDKRFSTPFK